MSHEELKVEQQRLAEAWARMLPNTLEASDKAKIWPDEADPRALRIHITSAGRSSYTFDFKCTYVDNSEVRIELVDVEKDDIHVDERTDIIQSLIQDYVRHIRECASQLHGLTAR